LPIISAISVFSKPEEIRSILKGKEGDAANLLSEKINILRKYNFIDEEHFKRLTAD
jgi:hypothetical protein